MLTRQSRDSLELKAYAKINLCLDVVGKRKDGYHNIVSVMQSISLYDLLLLKKVYKKNYLKIITNLWFLHADERNIVYKALKLMLEKYDVPVGVFADLKKSIPVSAGLGGGSSDCAVALHGFSKLFGLAVTKEELMNIGKTLGADVPFFFIGGTALAEGIGDILKPLPPLPPCYFLIARPPVFISTADIFSRFDMNNERKRVDHEKMIYFLKKCDLKGICSSFANALESVTAAEYPVIESLKQEMLAKGALGASMSGSGPTVFGCYADRHSAVRACSAIARRHPEIKELFVVSSR